MEGISGFRSGATHDFHDGENVSLAKVKTPQPSMSGLVEAASHVEKASFARMEALEQIASRLTSIASRLAGSYPASAPAARGGREEMADQAEPRSMIDATMRKVIGLHAPLKRMDAPLREIAQALEVLDSAVG